MEWQLALETNNYDFVLLIALEKSFFALPNDRKYFLNLETKIVV